MAKLSALLDGMTVFQSLALLKVESIKAGYCLLRGSFHK